MLIFEPEYHIYKLDGAQIPSITTVLPYNYHTDNTEAMDKGTAVHRMCYLENMGKDEDIIYCDPLILPYLEDLTFFMYLEAYKDFREKHMLHGIYDIKTGSPHPCTELQLAAQSILVSEGLACQGLTVRSCFESPLYHPQYKFAGTPDIVAIEYGEKMIKPYPVQALYLSDTGKFKLVDHSKNLRKNKQIFLSFLTTYKFKKENNLL